MCVIAYLEKGIKVENDEFKKIWNNNPDGFGLAYCEDSEWKVLKGMMEEETAWETFNQIQGEHTTICHWRLASCAMVRPKLTHPFIIRLKNEKRAVLFHRGHLHHFEYMNRNLSDTANFAKFLSSLKLSERQLMLLMLSKEFQSMLGYSKFVLLINGRKPILIGDFRVDKNRKFTDLNWKYNWYQSWYRGGYDVVKVGKGEYIMKEKRIQGTYLRGEEYLEIAKQMEFKNVQEATNYVKENGGAFVYEDSDGQTKIVRGAGGNKSIVLGHLYGLI